MDNKNETPREPRYVWPWFVLAAVVIGVVLSFIWMSKEVQRTREQREPMPLLAQVATSAPVEINIPGTNAILSKDPRMIEYHDTLHGGDAERGRKIFFDKPEANCGKCHKAGGQGGDNGPVLDGIGTRQPREFILESILYPNAYVLTNYETVIVLLKNGSGNSGTVKRETDTELVLNTPDDGLVTFRKSDIQERVKGLSPMPEGIWQQLSKQDVRDVIEFVATLPASNSVAIKSK